MEITSRVPYTFLSFDSHRAIYIRNKIVSIAFKLSLF